MAKNNPHASHSDMEVVPRQGLPWTEEALDLLETVPSQARDGVIQSIEQRAKQLGVVIVTPEIVRVELGKLSDG